jgi:predicted AlkP superfamily phosphohydrolase/phosphomutase
MNRRHFLKLGLAGAAGASLLGGLGDSSDLITRVYGQTATRRKLIILGFDGMDSQLFQGWLADGRLPAFKRLISQGDFRSLGTSIPPQSPVAWSNFITGMDPGGHGIFDFMHRDPSCQVSDLSKFIVFSASKTEEAKSTLKLGNLVLPLSGGKVKLLRRGRAFWQILEEHGIPSTIFKIPSNYPPAETRQRTFSGMGTPDILGTYGICNFYTTRSVQAGQEMGGGARVHEVYLIGNRVDAKLPGPVNSFKQDRPDTEVEFTVWVDPANAVAKVTIQGQEFLLREKEWSDWKHVRFGLIPTQSVGGICKFYLKEIRPEFKLYVTPVNIDPADPALPISTPDSYSRELAKRFGPFFTKGLPADTSALANGFLDEEEFLQMDDMILAEKNTLLEYELERFDSGVLFYYLSSTDQRQHMFWRLHDKNSPLYDPALAARYGNVIRDIYIAADRVLDRVMQKADKDTVIMVMSDHGFNPFNRCFNLNTWLKDNGYHTLINPWKDSNESFFLNTNWSKTQAYNIGLNSLYLNLKGREEQGAVEPGAEADRLLREIADKLEKTMDPKTGEKAVLKAFLAKDVYHGPARDIGPDLVVGFNRGFRISWGSPTGKIAKDVFEDNKDKWSGDHMGAPEVIPGILAMNRKIAAEAPSLYDLTPTILKLFGVEPPKEMRGRAIL